MMARFSPSVFLLLTFCLGCISASKNAIQTEFTCPPDAEGFFPGVDCTDTYYYCHQGAPTLQKCPCGEGTPIGECPVYDSTVERCVNPSDCVALATTNTPTTITTTAATTPTTTTPSTTTLPPTTLRPITCTSDGFFPVPASCTGSYYVCTSGVASAMVCPGTTIFDPVTYVCTKYEEASCVKPFECPTQTGTNYYPYSPDACSSLYYTCIGGVALLQYCPNNAVFLPDLLTCVPPGQTPPCTPGQTYTPASTTTTTTEATTTTTQSTTTTTQPTTTTATTTTTQPPTTTTTTQPPTTTTSTQPPTTTTTTQPPTTTTTTQPPTTTTTTQPPTTTTTTQPTTTTTTTPTTTTPTTTVYPYPYVCPTPDGKFPYEGNCTLYWWCQSSVPTLQQCPKDTGFNPETSGCQLAITLPQCNVRSFFPTFDIVNMDFVCPTSFGSYPLYLHKCVSSYISCDDGIPFNKLCPGGQVFDPIQTKCIQRKHSFCNEKRAKLAKIYGY